ncbi:unnamed protein product [Ilex paraguariensis]|uniref:Anthocyanidin synthase n=1 Tax=Ilex paraguariensis TaxID=185542 RepID=A0ABC8RDK7_9AQUA
MSMEIAGGEVIRVQSLSQNGKGQVPIQYIQPPENRPSKLNTPNTESSKLVPVIDLSTGRNADLLLGEIAGACREWGAFHVTNHGVPIRLLDDMRSAGRSFFEDSHMADKIQYSCNSSSPASEGYGSRMLVSSDDTVLDWRDYFDHHTLPISRRNPSRWPHFPPNYRLISAPSSLYCFVLLVLTFCLVAEKTQCMSLDREIVVDYSDHMKALAQKLLGLISESLGLPSLCIEESIGEFYQNITISYYPPCPQPELTLGLQAHSDMGAITFLIQDDVGGLEVCKDDGEGHGGSMGEAWQGAGMQLKLQKVLRVQRGTREQWSVEWSALRCRWPKVSKDMAGVLHDRHALRLGIGQEVVI